MLLDATCSTCRSPPWYTQEWIYAVIGSVVIPLLTFGMRTMCFRLSEPRAGKLFGCYCNHAQRCLADMSIALLTSQTSERYQSGLRTDQ